MVYKEMRGVSGVACFILAGEFCYFVLTFLVAILKCLALSNFSNVYVWLAVLGGQSLMEQKSEPQEQMCLVTLH